MPDLPDLPAPRGDGYRIELVCLGNICRSPMADVVLSAAVGAAGLDDRVAVRSSGTAGWHVGKAMDPRSAATLTAAGYDAEQHRARQFDPADLAHLDLVLVMDASNLADVVSTTRARAGGDPGADGRVRLFRDFDPVEPGGEVPDPYYGGDAGFEEVLAMVDRTVHQLVLRLTDLLTRGTSAP
ncbi:low molecular weight protein-tyrosine-phosphatase [Nocardioides sp.]|uniref:low molecular weight protein-tyrosine-phosphatase n=1 Tax=Nocardioides sp. TaxID=35761 RepID=UPI003564C726